MFPQPGMAMGQMQMMPGMQPPCMMPGAM
jgi:hypothetical protein